MRAPDSVYYQSAARLAAWPEKALIIVSNFLSPFLDSDADYTRHGRVADRHGAVDRFHAALVDTCFALDGLR